MALLKLIALCSLGLGFQSQLIHLQTGEKILAEKLLQDEQRALIYIDKDCAPCKQYMKTILKTCPHSLRESVRWISMNSVSQTREFLSRIEGLSVEFMYVLSGAPPKNKATPLTQTSKTEKVGILNCKELQQIL